MAFETYQKATTFGQRPSDVALLDECVDEIGRFYFDRGIFAFGEHVEASLTKAGTSKNPSIAAAQRQREWERLMGIDAQASTAFADPTGFARTMSDDDDESGTQLLDGGF